MSQAFVITVVHYAFRVYMFIVFGRVICSWLPISPYGKIYQFLFTMTEPLLLPIRKLMPRTMMLDFSPMILLFLLYFVERLLLILIYNLF